MVASVHPFTKVKTFSAVEKWLSLRIGPDSRHRVWEVRGLAEGGLGPSHSVPIPLSILGMHLFGCKFSLKTDSGDTVPDRKNFDSLLWAIVTVFQVQPPLSVPETTKS